MTVQAWRKKRMPSQREQYGSTVHLFIGTGHSPCKITLMPFTLDNNSIVICQGLNSLFIFKSVSPAAFTPKLSCLHLRRFINLRIILVYCDAWLESEDTCSHIILQKHYETCFWGPSDAEGPQQFALYLKVDEVLFDVCIVSEGRWSIIWGLFCIWRTWSLLINEACHMHCMIHLHLKFYRDLWSDRTGTN
jgi:hypothetical protein